MESKQLADLKKRLIELLKKESFKKGKFILSSGKESNYYLDGRIITMTPEGACIIARIMLQMIEGLDIQALGGPTLGADPIVGAVAAVSHIDNKPVKTFIVRKETKAHGMARQVEGPALKEGDKVVIVDDVATSGKSLIEAKAVLDKMGVKVVKALVIVDRLEGAENNLQAADCPLESILTIKELDV